MRVRSVAVLVALALVHAAGAAVRLPAIIGDHMVLQQARNVPLWGWAEPGEAVTVEFRGQTVRATADDDGRWQLELAPLAAGGPDDLTITAAGERTVLTDVLVGEVWLCSGQSNMEWPLRATRDAEREAAAADHPRIRLFDVENRTADAPQDDCAGTWSACSPATAPEFSAVGYFFGRALQQELTVPIGLVDTTWGGTPAEAWTSIEAMEAEPRLAGLLETRRGELTQRAQHRPAHLFNAMIRPLVPFAVRGAIWYQGESNASRAAQYRTLFPLMIKDWRAQWDQGPFGFHLVQLANFRDTQQEPGESDWAELREAQTLALRTLPGTGMAVTIDIGEANDIHPRNKRDVGHRLALAALASDYGLLITGSSPLYSRSRIEDGRMIIDFDHAGGGGLGTSDGQAPAGFAIAGRDRRFVWANVEVAGSSVVVWNDEIPNPVAVRYAWADNPIANLVGPTGLPVSPFRTDAWPGITDGRD